MKKLVFFSVIFFLLTVNIAYSQEIEWVIKENTQLILYNNKGKVDLKENEKVVSSKLTYLDEETNLIGYIYYKDYKGEIDANTLIPNNTSELFGTNILNKKFVILPYYNFDILSKKDRFFFKNLFKKDFWGLSGEYYSEQEAYEWFIERSYRRGLALNNAIINVTTNNEDGCCLFIENIKKIENGYECDGFLKYEIIRNTDIISNILITTPTQGKHTLLILFDGDYINVYEDSKEKLLMTYAITDDKTHSEFKNLLRTGKCDLSKVTWPRHADGSCDYDNEIKPPKFNFTEIKVNPVNSERAKENKIQEEATSITNVTKNKTMLVAENLKLRSGEATSTQVLTVMSAGTTVRVLELGKAEIIDGISSNWVKVEVQFDAKDRDGKPIKAGTIGWCYGGYLK